MERLTMDKPVGEMSMLELAHNCCYIKDGYARYRDYEKDYNTIDFILYLRIAYNFSYLPENEDAFDTQMLEDLQHGPEKIEGLIALFYRNLWAMAELRERLKGYEDTGLTTTMIQDLIKSCKKHEKNALENAHIVDEYRAIGTVEELQVLKEKENLKDE